MPSSLPIPSKGALRTLRQIALGTSCTVAFGAGLMTEDRRRRIHTAREVSGNARLLRASRRYHNARELAASATFEEQVESYYENGAGQDGTKWMQWKPNWSDELPDQKPPPRPTATLNDSRHSVSIKDSSLPVKVGFENAKRLTPSKSEPMRRSTEAQVHVCALPIARDQRRAAEAILGLLKGRYDRNSVKTAVATFHGAFVGGKENDAIEEPLLNACKEIARACEVYDMLHIYIPVFQKIIRSGPIDEAAFYDLRPASAITLLLKDSGYRFEKDHVIAPEHLTVAAAIYLTQLRHPPSSIAPSLRLLGIQLSKATFCAGFYDLTIDLYWRSACGMEDMTSAEISNLILATHRKGFHLKVLGHFSYFFAGTKPKKYEFTSVVRAAVDSALYLDHFDKVEEVLLKAGQIRGRHVIPINWLLRLIGQHWRAAHDLSSTQALFSRLESLLVKTDCPKAIYSAMIQFCVEAGEETEARKYLDKLVVLNRGDQLDTRTYGHLALGKAMKKDWSGVEDDFRMMKSMGLDKTADYGRVFAPILKLFTNSNSVSASEEFVRLYIEKLGVTLNENISNAMINMYCRAEELSNIADWIVYIRKAGLEFDAAAFNSVLSVCRKRWAARFKNLFMISAKTAKLAPDLINSSTVSILRSAAMDAAGGDPDAASTLLAKLTTFTSSQSSLRGPDVGESMRLALSVNNPAKALAMYHHAVQKQVPITPDTLATAVAASIESKDHHSLAPTIALLKDAKDRGVDVYPSLTRMLMHQVMNFSGDQKEFDMMIRQCVAEMEKSGLALKLQLASGAVSTLVSKGRFRQAISFWRSFASTYYISSKSLDLVLLSVLLRAYIALSDCVGIQWIMNVLNEHNTVADKELRLILKDARRRARRAVEAAPFDVRAKDLLCALDNSMQQVVKRRLEGRLQREEAEKMVLSIVRTAVAVKPEEMVKKERKTKKTMNDTNLVQQQDSSRNWNWKAFHTHPVTTLAF